MPLSPGESGDGLGIAGCSTVWIQQFRILRWSQFDRQLERAYRLYTDYITDYIIDCFAKRVQTSLCCLSSAV